MVRKFISIVLCVILLLSMSVPAFAVTNNAEPTEAKTIEEILSEYHEKAFLNEVSTDTASPSAYSRTGGTSGKTLEEETVDELIAAGYEAYNVTSANYDILENNLNTNFEELGLDRNGSYIIVISGEEPGSSNNAYTTTGSEPGEDSLDPDDDSFLYYYEPFDRYFSMRYVWVTCDRQTASVDVVSTFGALYTNLLANNDVTGYVKSNSIYTTGDTLGTLRSLWGLDSSVTYSNPSLTVQCAVDWSRKYIQVLDESINEWAITTHSEYASINTTFTGHYLNSSTSSNDYVSYRTYTTIYSPNYHNSEEMKVKAVMFITGINPTYDRTQEIQVKVTDHNGVSRVLVTVREDF